MDAALEVFKAYLIPGSLSFLALGLLVGAILLHAGRSTRRWGGGILGFLAVLYLILSIPAVARSYERLLADGSEPIRSPAAARGAQAIVVLGGGSVTYRADGAEINELSDASSLRVLEGARLYQLLDGLPVVVSGGADELEANTTPESVPMQQELLEAGVPRDMILLESRSGNTREQAENLALLLEARGLERFVLVTSPIHMRRALASMRAMGLDAIPSPAKQHTDGHAVLRGSLLPSPAALDASRAALREAIALIYYWAQGWIEFP